MDQLTAIRDLADLLAEVIRRMGAAYGSQEDWHRDFKTAVSITEYAHRTLAEEK